MKDEIVSKDNLSKELLREVFEDAYMEVTYDSDGDLMIKDQYTHYVEVDKDSRFVAYRCNLRGNENATEMDRFKYVGMINREVIAIRVAETQSGYSFDCYLWVEGGVTKRNIVLTFKRFASLVEYALSKAPEGLFT